MSSNPNDRKATTSGLPSEQPESATSARRESSRVENRQEHPRYIISVAAQVLGVHPQTLRLYEREGLVEPGRTRGKIRLYSENDLEQVRLVMRLTNDLGVNLAGAEAILNMRRRMLEMRAEVDRLHRELEATLERYRAMMDIDSGY